MFHIDVQHKSGYSTANAAAHESAELQSHLTAASDSLRLIEAMQGDPNSSWGDNPPHKKRHLRSLDDSQSCTYPASFLHQAGRQQPQTAHSLQLPAPPAPRRLLAEVQSAPASGALDYLTGMSQPASANQLHHQLQQQHAIGELGLERLGVSQLQELLGMGSAGKEVLDQQDGNQLPASMSGNSLFKSSLSRVSLPQDCQQGRSSPQVQPTGSAGLPVSPCVLTSTEHSHLHQPFGKPFSGRQPQPMVQNAFSSHLTTFSSAPSHAASPFGLPQGSRDSLLQQRPATALPLKTATDVASRVPVALPSRETPAHQLPFQPQPEASGALSLPFRGLPQSHLHATSNVASNYRLSGPSSSQAGGHSQALSALSHQTAVGSAHKPGSAMSLSEQLSQGLRPPASAKHAQWQNLPQRVPMLSPFDTPPEPAPGPTGTPLQKPLLQTQSPSDSVGTKGNSAAHTQWFDEPGAMRQAALVLNSQLAQVDKQVLEHIVPRCGHQGKGGSGITDAYVIQTQVLPSAFYKVLHFLHTPANKCCLSTEFNFTETKLPYTTHPKHVDIVRSLSVWQEIYVYINGISKQCASHF